MRKKIKLILFFLIIFIQAQSQIQLNQTFAGSFAYPYVHSYKVSSDGQTVVYAAIENSKMEIYSVSIDSGAVTKLNIALGTQQTLHTYLSSYFEITPDGTKVLYSVRNQINGVIDLYSVPIQGGTSIQLTPSRTSSNASLSFKVSPTSQDVVFVTDLDILGLRELYSVPITGGASVKLHPAINYDPAYVGNKNGIFSYEISHDGSLVAFSMKTGISPLYIGELYVAPIGGGTAVKLSNSVTNGVDNYEFTPNDSMLVFTADQNLATQDELYKVSILGGTSTKLNTTVATGLEVNNFQIYDDGSNLTIVYTEVQYVVGGGGVYSVPISGGTPVKLSGTLTRLYTPVISSTHNRVVFGGTNASGEVVISSAPISGGSLTQISQSIANRRAGGFYKISPDGNHLVYAIEELGPDPFDPFTMTIVGREIYSVPLGGGTSTKLNGTLVFGGMVSNGWQISSDGQTVAYRADQETSGVNELYSVPITGGIPEKVNDSLVSGSVEYKFEFLDNTNDLLYIASQDMVYHRNLYRFQDGCSNLLLCRPLAETSGLYTGDTSVTDANGFTHYFDANENLLLSIKVPAGWTIPDSAVSLAISPLTVKYWSQYCGNTGANVCFISNANGAPVINRRWYVNPNLITITGSPPFIDVIFYFTEVEYNALNAELTIQGLSTLSSYTDIQLYKVNDPLSSFGEYPGPPVILPWSQGNVLTNNSSPTTINWVGGIYSGTTAGYSAHFQVVDFNGGGALGGIMRP